MNPFTLFRLVKQALGEWREDKAARLGAALAYYALFSLAPLLVIAVGIAGLVYGEEAARGQLARELRSAVGTTAATAIQDLLRHTRHTGTGLLATLLGFGTLLFGAAGLFWQVQDALDTVWKVAPKPGRGILGIVRDRSLPFLLVLGIGLFLLLSLAANTTLVALTHYFPLLDLPGGTTLWHGVNGVVSVLINTLLFATLYKILPDVRIAWRDVWVGSALTALLFAIGRHLLSLYLGYMSVTSAFGAAGSLVLLLVWVYYSAQLFLFGAEFIRAYATYHGSHPVPRDNARLVTSEDRARQEMP
jgi:membrane protein